MTLTPYRFARLAGIGLWQVTVWGSLRDREGNPVDMYLVQRPAGWSLHCPALQSTLTTGGLDERRLPVVRIAVAAWRRQLAERGK